MNILTLVLASGLVNASNKTGEKISEVSSLTGNWQVLVGAVAMIVFALILIYLLKDIIANAIIGIILLIFLKFFLGIPIPLTPLVLLITVLGGVGGVGAVLIASYLGWL